MSRLPPGCPFVPRCAWAMGVCRKTMPPLASEGPLERACQADPEDVR